MSPLTLYLFEFCVFILASISKICFENDYRPVFRLYHALEVLIAALYDKLVIFLNLRKIFKDPDDFLSN